MDFCAQCGVKLSGSESFCSGCGARLESGPVQDQSAKVTPAQTAREVSPLAAMVLSRYGAAAFFLLIVIGFNVFALSLMSQFKEQAANYGSVGEIMQGALDHSSIFLGMATICFAIAGTVVLRSGAPYIFWWTVLQGLVCQKLVSVFVNPTMTPLPGTVPIPMASAAIIWIAVSVVLAWPRIRINLPPTADDQGLLPTSGGATLWITVAAAFFCLLQTGLAITSYITWKDPSGRGRPDLRG